ncbi:MAG: M20/M25/M40 family metallo-hydrolase [Gammaproteobacteria bacterium]|nr:M20/M25/M40 family metallo-hydrolase [Gammaproteobacteria bacterium]
MAELDLIDRIDTRESLEFLAAMIRFKSYSAAPGERELAEFMVERMQALGLAARLQTVEADRYNAIGTLAGAGGGRSLLFNGHLDTNPATEGWTVDPWGGLYDDAFSYGIGVSNMKAGDAAAFMALKTLVDSGVHLRGDVVLEYVVGELQGGIGTVKAIESDVRADAFINMEPTDLNGLTLHAGSFNVTIELTGITRHVSKREEAVDAIAAACALVPRFNALTFSGAANAAHASVNRANIGVIRGSLTPEFHDWRPPQVADFVRMAGTARYAPSQSEESVLADIRALLDTLEAEVPGLRAKVEKQYAGERPSMLPFEVSLDEPIVRTVASAYERVRGDAQSLGPVAPYCFYGTDAAHLLHRAGMPGIVCGPGGRYNTMPDERVDVADYLDMIRIYMLAMLEHCGIAE